MWRSELPFSGVVICEYSDDLDVPAGCVVWSDGRSEWLVFAPSMVDQMRHDCPICSG
jgi:hypothetical protein